MPSFSLLQTLSTYYLGNSLTVFSHGVNFAIVNPSILPIY